MISIAQAIVIGLIQGITELFPISSLGHSVIVPQLLGWQIHQRDHYFLSFLVATHLATAIVLFLFFFRDWISILKGLARSLRARTIDPQDNYAKLGWLLVIGTIPAGILGLLFDQQLGVLFASARVAAYFLIVNGVILLIAERLRQRANQADETKQQRDTRVAGLSWLRAFGIGTVQAAALLPGISRSGSSMAAGLASGLNNQEAARFSFLLATPIIGAAAVLKLPELFSPAAAPVRLPIALGSLAAAGAAYVSVNFLVRYFRTNTLLPFAVYCVVAGAAAAIYLTLR